MAHIQVPQQTRKPDTVLSITPGCLPSRLSG
jgi:hypothetical protein